MNTFLKEDGGKMARKKERMNVSELHLFAGLFSSC